MKWRLDPGRIEVMDDAMAELLRKKTPAEKVEIAFRLHRMLFLAIRHLHPDWIDSQVGLELLRGAELGEYPIYSDDILNFCSEKASPACAARWAEESGLREIWDAIQKRLSEMPGEA